MIQVVVILVNWNGKQDTLDCLTSLQSTNGVTTRVIVVDNGSGDDSVVSIKGAFPAVEIISTGENLGFAGGNNIGITRALEFGSDYIFLLNNDTTLEPDAIFELVSAAQQQPDAGLLTPLTHYFDYPQEPWFAGAYMDLSRGIAVHDNSMPPGRSDDLVEVPWASGCAMLFPSSVLRNLGGFDERFFLNWEDVDLSLRVRNAGMKILLVPSAKIYHKVGRSFANACGVGTYYFVRNNLLLLRLHVKQGYLSAYLRITLGCLRSALRSMKRREPHSFRSLKLVCRGIFDDFRGKFGAAKGLDKV